MNAKLSKQLRRAAELDSRTATQYEEQKYRTRLYEKLQPDGQIALEPFQCPLPLRLKRCSPRAVYKQLKVLQKRVGFDRVYQQLQADAVLA